MELATTQTVVPRMKWIRIMRVDAIGFCRSRLALLNGPQVTRVVLLLSGAALWQSSVDKEAGSFFIGGFS